MPQTNRADYKQYQREYYLKNIKKANTRPYKKQNAEPVDDDIETSNCEYSDEDPEEIQAVVPPHPSKNFNNNSKINHSLYENKPINVDKEYNQFIKNKEYIQYPYHLQQPIQHHLKSIHPMQFTFM
jgi:hypothetical protein